MGGGDMDKKTAETPTAAPDPQSASATSTSTAPPSASTAAKHAYQRAFTDENLRSGKRFLSAYAKTWVGMSPLYLMSEAVTPGKKVGSKFRSGLTDLSGAAVELQQAVTTSSKDILIIVDQQLRVAGEETGKTAEVIKAAGENAMVVVTTSIDKAQAQIHRSSPELKKAVLSNGKDCLILVDKALKNPIVIGGVTKFAQTKGIPRSEAILQLASMGLAKIIAAIPDPEDVEDIARVVELDAAELERTSTREAEAEAVQVGKAGAGPAPQVKDGSAKKKDGGNCVVS